MTDSTNAPVADDSLVLTIAELATRIEECQPVAVLQDGQITTPEEAAATGTPLPNYSIITPSRWFARSVSKPNMFIVRNSCVKPLRGHEDIKQLFRQRKPSLF